MTKQPDWWKNFFSGLALDLWREAILEGMTRAEANFLLKVFQLPLGSTILDVLCRNGRILS